MKKVLSVLLAMYMVLGLAACSGETGISETEPTGTTETQTDKDTLVIGAYAYASESLDIASSRNAVGMYAVFDTLLTLDYSDGQRTVTPLIAESYEFLEQDGEYTMHVHLRDDLTFASGNPIRASDVLYTYQQVMNSSAASTYSSIDIENSYIDGDQDVYFKLFNYDPNLPQLMCEYNTGIVSEEWYANATEEDFWGDIDSSGPFSLVEFVTSSHMKFAVRDDYWGWGIVQERPAYDYILFNFYSDASTMFIDYELGELDVALSLSSADVERVQNDGMEGSTLRTVSTMKFRYLALSYYAEQFQDPAVRKAISLAIDTSAVVEAVYGPTGVASNGFMPLGTEYRLEFEHEYDPEAAKALLKEAGYEDGDISFDFVTDQDAQCLTMAEIIQEYLNEVGITMNIQSYESTVAIPMYRNGECDAFFNLTTSSGYPSSVYVNIAASSSTMKGATIEDEELNDLLDRGVKATDPAEAQEIYEAVQNWQNENYWSVPMVDTLWTLIYRNYVDGELVNTPCLTGVGDLRHFDFVS